MCCPVPGCLRGDPANTPGWTSFTTMRNHLNDHCAGRAQGAIPTTVLNEHRLLQCSVCSLLCSARYNGVCPRCRPAARAAALPTQPDAPPIQAGGSHAHAFSSRPSLEEVHAKQVPTLRHIPKCVRALWAQCVARTFATAVWKNDTHSWVEVQMMAKCVLCAPPRSGKAHRKQRESYTRARCSAWLAGDRDSLWASVPVYPDRKQARRRTDTADKQRRCTDLCREAAYGMSCKALTSNPPLDHSARVVSELEAKHPRCSRVPDLSHLGPANAGLVPTLDRDAIEKAIRSFHPRSGAGPSAFLPVFLKEALATEFRDEVLEHTASLVGLLAAGRAPLAVAPFPAGATLTAL